MKYIKRFNEELKNKWLFKPGDKIVKGTLHYDFEINKNELDIDDDNDLMNAVVYYLQGSIDEDNIENLKLVDYDDNEIDDEEFYDDTRNFNL